MLWHVRLWAARWAATWCGNQRHSVAPQGGTIVALRAELAAVQQAEQAARRELADAGARLAGQRAEAETSQLAAEAAAKKVGCSRGRGVIRAALGRAKTGVCLLRKGTLW